MKTFSLVKKIFCSLLILAVSSLTFAQQNIPLVATPWKLNSDGNWITTVHAVNVPHSVDLHTSKGQVVPLARWTYDGSAINIILHTPSAITVTAKMRRGNASATMSIPSPLSFFQGLQLSAQALGPYLINLGWAWLDSSSLTQYQILRQTDNKGDYQKIAVLDAQTTHFQDNNVAPNHHYHYQLIATTSEGKSVVNKKMVTTPPEMAHFSENIMRGKGIILVFTTDPKSFFYYKKLIPKQIIEDAHNLGIRYIELRTVYAGYSEFNSPSLMKWVDEMLDYAHQYHIPLISWSIPRMETSDSIAGDIAAAAHKTPAGNSFAGMALDLEAGQGYFSTQSAKQQIAEYGKLTRMAVGPNYLLSGIVFSPWKNSSSRDIPYAELATVMNLLQPMEFWHSYYQSAHHVYTDAEVTEAIRNTILLTRQYAKKDVPINIIGQAVDLGNTGAPSPREITVALQAAKNYGALGMTFFDWHDKLILQNQQFSLEADAIHNFPW